MKLAILLSIVAAILIANSQWASAKSVGSRGGGGFKGGSRSSGSYGKSSGGKSSSKSGKSGGGWSWFGGGKAKPSAPRMPTSSYSYSKPAYRPMPTYYGQSMSVVSRPRSYSRPMFIPIFIPGPRPYYYGGYHRSRYSDSNANSANYRQVTWANGPEVNRELSCPFSEHLCSYYKNANANGSNYVDFSQSNMKLIVDVGYVFSPYVISHYPLCMSFSYRLEAEHYDDKEAAFVIEEENELTGKIKTIYQDSEVVSAWRTSNVTLETVSLSVDKSQDKGKSFRIRLKVQSTKYNNYVRIKDVKVADGACNAVLDKSNVNQSDFADYRDDFVCYNSTGFVGRHMLCDGVQDCPAAEDEFPEMCETNCTDKGIFCKPKNSTDKAFCFSDMSKMCDGTEDCENGADEDPNMCDPVKYCYHPFTDYCKNLGNCISANGQKGADCQCTSYYSGKRCQVAALIAEDEGSSSNFWIIGFVILLIVIIAILIFRSRRKRMNKFNEHSKINMDEYKSSAPPMYESKPLMGEGGQAKVAGM